MGRVLLLLGVAAAVGALLVGAYLHFAQPEEPLPESREEAAAAADPAPEAPDEPEAAPGGILTGKVLTRTGEPVAGALVSARQLASDSWPDPTSEPVVASGPTDAEGRFGFSEILPGSYMLTAQKGERVGYLPAVWVKDGAERQVVIYIAEPVTIEGRVIRDDRMPVVDAVVTTDLGGVLKPFYGAIGILPPPLEERFEAKTGPGGIFRIGPLIEGQYDLKVTAPGLESVIVRSVYAPIDGIDIEMRQGIELRGAVCWRAGQSPENLRVWADLPRPTVAEMEAEGEHKSDWVLRWFGNGRYRVRAVADGFCESYTDVEVEPGRRQEPFTIDLQPAVPVSGNIVLPFGAPAKREIVFRRVIRRLTWPGHYYPRGEISYGESHTATYDKSGKFKTCLAPGRWLHQNEQQGFHLVHSGDEFRVSRKPVVLKNLVLQRFGVVRGLVTYHDGTPAVGAKVEVVGYREYGAHALTNLYGEYEIWGLARKEVYRISARVPGSTEGRAWDIELPEDGWVVQMDFTLKRDKVGTARGRIVDLGGTPAPGALVFLNGIPCEAGPDGRFELQRIHPDFVRVVYFALGFTVAERVFEDKAEDDIVDLGDLVLERKGTSLTGSVLDSEGHPIGGARISARFGSDYYVDDVASGPDGRYEITGPAHLQEAWIEVSAPGRTTSKKWLRTRSSGDSAVIKLQELAYIRGTLDSPGHRPAYVDLAVRESKRRKYDYEWMELEARIGEGGRSFTAELQWKGEVEIRILAEGCAVKDLTSGSLGPGEVLDIGKVELEPGYHIEGRVQGGGSNQQLCVVELGLVTRSDREGKFRFDHVPEGTWTLREYRAWRKSIGPTMKVTVEQGRLYPVEFNLGG